MACLLVVSSAVPKVALKARSKAGCLVQKRAGLLAAGMVLLLAQSMGTLKVVQMDGLTAVNSVAPKAEWKAGWKAGGLARQTAVMWAGETVSSLVGWMDNNSVVQMDG